MSPKIAPLTEIQQQWTTMYRETLPSLARTKHSKSSASPWPVQLDHCFARIILDNVVGVTQPWHEVIKAPATRNMNDQQLEHVLLLGKKIADGEEDLWVLDARSLEMRGKAQKIGNKRRRAEDQVETVTEDVDPKTEQDGYNATIEASPPKKSRKQVMADIWSNFSAIESKSQTSKDANGTAALAAIRKTISSDTTLTPFRKLILTLLTQVPRGRHTSYQALSDAALQFSATSPTSGKKNGCARAVGSAMRNNPYAPDVPCHRVLASDGKIGGFKGDWGEDGRFVSEKRRLLQEEGVRFDGRGKVVGEAFRGFWAV